MMLGAVITAGIYTVNSFHSLDSSYRAGLLGASEGFILVGAVMFLIGWFRRGNEKGTSGSSR